LQRQLLPEFWRQELVTLTRGLRPRPPLLLPPGNIKPDNDHGIHNPPQYNGIKLLNPDGSAFSEEQQDEIEKTDCRRR